MRNTVAVCVIVVVGIALALTFNKSLFSSSDSSVTGTIKYSGAVPKMKTLKMDADPKCAAKHSTPVLSESLVLGDGNTMGNVFVRVKSGLPAKEYTAPTDPVVISQDGCLYKPHVFGVMKGQSIKFLNKDGTLHNVHALPKVNRPFNISMPATMTESPAKKFVKVEDAFKIKCDVHPWMNSYVAVMAHPYFSVTAKDGKFTISGLPAGTYEIEAWHEKLGTQTASITVGAGEAKTADFSFSRP